MKILFFILSIFILSACSHLQFISMHDKASSQQMDDKSKLPLHRGCGYYPFDNSDSPCNLFGWQTFVYTSLSQTKKEHNATLLSLGTSQRDEYKRSVLLANHNESFAVRAQAIEALFAVSSKNDNSFGYFFYILATLQKQALFSEQNSVAVDVELKKSVQKNAKLKAELADTQAKIQAIMEIEKNLKTN